MNFTIHTLGCKVNQYESQAMAAMLTELGHREVEAGADCDAVIVNTCAVTAESVRKSRQAIRRLAGLAPGAVVAVCGCWPQAEPEEAAALGVDVLWGSGDRAGFAAAVLAAVERQERAQSIDKPFQRRRFEELPPGSPGDRTRALLKIEDGCVNFCAYCVIPYARGRVLSLPLERAAAQAAELSARGYREIVLTGIEIASYGADLPGKPRLQDCIAAVAEAAPGVRIRLGSLEPSVVDEDFCAVLTAHPNLCDHFHLSLQSGCDATLQRMRRKYDTARFWETVSLLRRHFPGCALTADLICGFPGETEAEFQETLAFLARCAFSQVHIFPYSVRQGTPAAEMPGQLDRGEKQSRVRRAQAVAARTRQDYLSAQVGKTLPILFEQEIAPGLWQGHSTTYLPVRAAGEHLKNVLAPVFIENFDAEGLIGTLEPQGGPHGA